MSYQELLLNWRALMMVRAAGLMGLVTLSMVGLGARMQDEPPPLRPPSVPLVACDPYFSVWSNADRLTDTHTSHWTRRRQSLLSLVRVDGRAWRIMGDEPKDVPAMTQKSVTVHPTRTIYEFAEGPVAVTLTFTTPVLPDDIDVLSRPVTYLSWEVRPADGASHDVSIYFSASGELAVNEPGQRVTASRQAVGSLTALRIGSEEQPVLQKRGDDLRIDWGWAYAAAPKDASAAAIGAQGKLAAGFAAGEALPADDARFPRAANDETPAMAFAFALGKVGAPARRRLILAYDDEFSIQFMLRNQRPYWRRKGMDAAGLLAASEKEGDALLARCKAFDDELMADLRKAGGERYARLCALAYRQCHAANKVTADAAGMPHVWPKENFSNGCIATVDVFYPMAPQFLLFNPTLAKSSFIPVLVYAASERWKFPFAPHDLGTYPHANGQVYGGGERTEDNQMPVEESANMLILLAAVAKIDGDAGFSAPFWPQLVKWAQYLEAKGFDPENQLCTDDFAGHLARNTNLSVKAIVGLGSFGMLAKMRGDAAAAEKYAKIARELAARWVKEADDGDHFRLTFDRAGTWSQKYNLAWDRILGLGLFPSDVAKKEMAWYRKVQKKYGLPLDNRQAYTKLDWILWTATLTGDRADFEALVGPVYDFMNATPDRVPLTDWYRTDSAKHVGFVARPVIGGVFMQMLTEPALWRKYASRDKTPAAKWAPMPQPPAVKEIVPTARQNGYPCRYTLEAPPDGWFKPDFDDSGWKEGQAGFGIEGTPAAAVRTPWKTRAIWLRRSFNLDSDRADHILIHHDEDAEVYLNGVLAARLGGYTTDYQWIPIPAAAKAALRRGKNVIAVHCRQTVGGQYIDVGLAEVSD
jgi:hypothetical protein